MSALAAALVIALYAGPDAEVPFKEIRCALPSCTVNGLLPMGDVSIPVAYSARLEADGRLSLEMSRGSAIRYGVRPFRRDTALQPVRLFRARSREGQDALLNDLVQREDADLGAVWVTARMEE